MASIESLLLLLKLKKSVAIFSHTKPDADALGSCLTLKQLLKDNANPKQIVDIFIDYDENETPLLKPFLENQTINQRRKKRYDVAVALDCTDLSRFAKYVRIFEHAKHSINIDHHATNTKFAKFNFVMPDASSTCEVLMAHAILANLTITEHTAKYAYMGIVTDTNNLQNNVKPTTYAVLTHIAAHNIDMDGLKDHFFKNNSLAKTVLLQKALRSLKLYDNDQIAIMQIKNTEITSLEATKDDTLGIVDHANSIEGVKIAALLIEEQPEQFYVSLRSKNNVDVTKVAAQFLGGGHQHAAAFQYHGDCKELLTNLVLACKDTLTQVGEETPELQQQSK